MTVDDFGGLGDYYDDDEGDVTDGGVDEVSCLRMKLFSPFPLCPQRWERRISFLGP